ncbi:MAG: SCO family protein [Myxococcota bacterium]
MRGRRHFFGPLWGLVLLISVACGARADLHDAVGVVQEIDLESQQIVIEHDDIPGLMPAMVMSFDVGDPALLEQLEPGQRIRFRLQHGEKSFRILSAVTIGEGEAHRSRIANLLEAAEPAPDFALTDQAGAERTLASLRGKTVLLDFVYTSCPGPCPILTGTHVQVQKQVATELAGRVWFVSISLDPARDTPTALRQYAKARGADLLNWSFLTGDAETISGVLEDYGVGAVPGKDFEIDHLVVTFLIDGEGRIVERYLGLEHDAETLAQDLAAVAAAGS